MARFEVKGLDELNAAFSKLEDVPEEVTAKVIQRMGEVAIAKIKESGEAMGVRDPKSRVHILDKMKLSKIKVTPTGGRARITFYGTRKRGKKNPRKTPNAYIAYVNEFGNRGVKARPFIRQAMNQGADEIATAGSLVFFDWFEENMWIN